MMRITNSMMMNTTKLNINNNKVSVDRLNTQMSTQKKITKPSDNPLIAHVHKDYDAAVYSGLGDGHGWRNLKCCFGSAGADG